MSVQTKSKKEFIISCFEKIDIDTLELLLDSSRTYQEATKEMFLKKLKIAFDRFKSEYNTELKAFRGKCVSKECPNTGCSGYSFAGNNTDNHLDLIFSETEDDFSDIHDCVHFKPDDLPEDQNYLILIDILEDEKADFKPSIEFQIKLKKCMDACEELKSIPKKTSFDAEPYLYWLEKHKELFSSFEFPPRVDSSMYKFHSMYEDIYNISRENESI